MEAYLGSLRWDLPECCTSLRIHGALDIRLDLCACAILLRFRINFDGLLDEGPADIEESGAPVDNLLSGL